MSSALLIWPSHMTTIEKVAIILCLICGFILNLLALKTDAPFWISITLATLTIGSMLGLSIYYLVKTKYSIYQVIFALLTLWPLGAVLALLYWQGYEVLSTMEVLAYPIISVLLFRTAIMRYRDFKEIRMFYITIALVLLAQFVVSAIAPIGDHTSFAQLLDYIMLAALLAMWLYRKVITIPETRVMTLIGLQAALFVISDVATYMVEYPFSF